ncbi:MAG: glutamine synthetase family protein [Eubacteriales bacterium]|jgi:glutamine synthetase
MNLSVQEVLQFVKENDVKFIRLVFCDMFGHVKNVAIMASQLPRAFRSGVAFDASAISGFMNVEESDLYLFPDPDTMAVVPWRTRQERVVRFYCDIKHPDGTPFEGDGRMILKHAIARAEEMGYDVKIGSEADFYLFQLDEAGQPTRIPHDSAGFLDVAPLDKGEDIRREICLALEEMGVTPQTSLHESGPGQNEIIFKYGSALTAADDLTTFKTVVRALAAQGGLHATFMPKPFKNHSGCGLHVNLSLNRNGTNIFQNDSDRHCQEAESFIAGILAHIYEMTAFLNSATNSYERFGSFEAPRWISWSHENRSQLIRIPPERGEHARMELRSPDLSCNQYIAFALLIHAGLDGIQEKMTLRSPCNFDLYNAPTGVLDKLDPLPENLREALDAVKASDFIARVLPEVTLEKFLAAKYKEWDAYRYARDKSEFEFETYFTRL